MLLSYLRFAFLFALCFLICVLFSYLRYAFLFAFCFLICVLLSYLRYAFLFAFVFLFAFCFLICVMLSYLRYAFLFASPVHSQFWLFDDVIKMAFANSPSKVALVPQFDCLALEAR